MPDVAFLRDTFRPFRGSIESDFIGGKGVGFNPSTPPDGADAVPIPGTRGCRHAELFAHLAITATRA